MNKLSFRVIANFSVTSGKLDTFLYRSLPPACFNFFRIRERNYPHRRSLGDCPPLPIFLSIIFKPRLILRNLTRTYFTWKFETSTYLRGFVSGRVTNFFFYLKEKQKKNEAHGIFWDVPNRKFIRLGSNAWVLCSK